MTSIDRPPAGGNSGPFALRAEHTPEPPEPHPVAPGEPVGYWFDAVPKSIRHDPRLKAIDHWVVAILVSLTIWRRDSAWTTIRFIASQIPAIRPGRSGMAVICQKTAQRSIKRLITHGHLRREPVAVPDPDDPRNTTGYRYYFRWHADQATTSGGATQSRGGVTKAQPQLPPTGGGVTKEGPDSLVTQIRSEVREPEPTLNVATLAGVGGPTMTVGLVAAEEIPPALARANPVREDEVPAPVAVPSAAPDPDATRPAGPAKSEDELAEELVRMVRAGGVDLHVETDPVRGEVIQPVKLCVSARELSPEMIARLKRLRPQVLAYLKGGPGSGSGPPGGSSAAGEARATGPRPAPSVPKAAQARVMALIGRLASEAGPAIVEGLVDELARALGDDKPESRRLYRGLAAEVQAGTKPADLLIGAFEWGCGRGGRHRGRLFTQGVNDWLRRNGRGHPPG